MTIVMTGKTKAQVLSDNQVKLLKKEKETLQKVLADTQQYILDRAEFGTEIPDNIKQQRQAARIRLAEIAGS